MKRSYVIGGLTMAAAVACAGSMAAAQNDPSCAAAPGPVFNDVAKPVELPPSVARQIEIAAAPEIRLAALDPAFIKQAEQPCAGKCLQIGIARPLAVGMNQGLWMDAGDGMIWVSDIVVEGALAVRVHLNNINLPPGARLVAYSPQPVDGVLIMAGPYQGKGLYDHGSVWTQEIPGQRVRLECFVPAHPKLNVGQLSLFEVDEVQHIYRDPLSAQDQELVPTNCTDVTCQPAWANQARAVARITYVSGGTFLCTGQLLNTIAGDLTPYFLTANHCISTNGVANTVTCYWMYQTSTCNGAPPSLGSVPTSVGATLLSTGAASDYTLMMIDGALPCGLYWLGWNSGAIGNGTSGACIHHPGGTWKRIALGTKQNAFGCGGANHIGVNWTGPTGTEPGSSGSAFIIPAQGGQVIGQLHCGPSACENPSNDDYGAFQSTYPNISGLLNVGSDDGFEPNDSCAAAFTIGSGTNNGLVVKGVSDDWYRISIPGGQQLTVSLSFVHANGDVDMALYATCGGSVVASSTSTSNSELINYTNNGATANFFLRVYLFGCDTRNNYNMTRSFSTPAPPNNTCANATPIGNGTYSFSTVGATTDGPDEPGSCNFFGYTQVGADIWFRYTAGCTGSVRVNLCDSSYDTKVAVYGSNCPAGASAIACNDDACGNNGLKSELTFNAVMGNQYLIRVGGYQGAIGNGTLRVTCPANDDCLGGPLVGNGAWPYSTTGATTDGPDEPGSCNFFGYTQVGADVWFRYTATCNSPVTVKLCSSTYDSKVAVYQGSACPSSASAIACNDDACGGGLQSRLTFNASAGTQYRIRIGGYQSATGAGTMIITCCPSDVNFDGQTNVQDLLFVINAWGACAAPPANCQADINGDLLTNVTDMLAVINGWGACPP